MDLWRFQLKEIHEQAPSRGEDQKLESEKRVLANSERVYGAAVGAFEVLYEVEESAIARLRAATKHLEELSRFDESFKESLGQLENATNYGGRRCHYAARLRGRHRCLSGAPCGGGRPAGGAGQLRRKYGKSLDDVLAFEQEIAGKLDDIENKDELLAGLRKELAAATAKYLDEACDSANAAMR